MRRAEIEQIVTEVLVRDLGVERAAVRPEARLEEDLGLDSLGVVEFWLAVEEACRVTVPDEQAQQVGTVGEAVELAARLGGPS